MLESEGELSVYSNPDSRSSHDRLDEHREGSTRLHRPLLDRCHDVTHILSELFPDVLAREPSIDTGNRRATSIAALHSPDRFESRYVMAIQKVRTQY